MAESRSFSIGTRKIGSDQPCFIIAEAGVNHNGQLVLAKKLVDAAKEAGADAVKFQTFTADTIAIESAPKATYQKRSTTQENQHEMLKKLELSKNEFDELIRYCNEKKIIFLSSPFDEASVDLLEKIGVGAFKVGSGEITNTLLLEKVAKTKKPIIISTGMATMDEIKEAVTFVTKKGNTSIALLHCISQYPTPLPQVNLQCIGTLRNKFSVPIGFSDHTTSIIIPAAAVALGACIIEKHLTLEKTMEGPDHLASLDPVEFKQMVRAIRDVEAAFGTGIKEPTTEEEEMKKIVRKSIVANTIIPKGTVLTHFHLAVKRPGTGLEPKRIDELIGKKVNRLIKKDEFLSFDMVA